MGVILLEELLLNTATGKGGEGDCGKAVGIDLTSATMLVVACDTTTEVRGKTDMFTGALLL